MVVHLGTENHLVMSETSSGCGKVTKSGSEAAPILFQNPSIMEERLEVNAFIEAHRAELSNHAIRSARIGAATGISAGAGFFLAGPVGAVAAAIAAVTIGSRLSASSASPPTRSFFEIWHSLDEEEQKVLAKCLREEIVRIASEQPVSDAMRAAGSLATGALLEQYLATMGNQALVDAAFRALEMYQSGGQR